MKVVNLPPHDDMLRRLRGVSDDAQFQDRIYPLLLKYAGAEVNGMDVWALFANVTIDAAFTIAPVSKKLVNRVRELLPEFIDALVDDAEVASKAKTFELPPIK